MFHLCNGLGLLIILLLTNYISLQGAPIPGETSENDGDAEDESLFEGDILGRDTHAPETDMQHNVKSSEGSLWPGGLVPYQLINIRGNDLANRIHKAMGNISERTSNCIRFVKRTNETFFFNVMEKPMVCAADVGRNSRRRVHLSRDCDDHSIIHELLHSLGFYHEHTRRDRDKYITIHEDNILEKYRINYKIMEDGDGLGHPYDYRSIMHYPPNAPDFAKNRDKPIMTAIGNVKLATNMALSELDILKISTAYKCLTEPLCNISVGRCHVFRRGLETFEKSHFLKTYVQVTECEGEDMNRVAVYCDGQATIQDVKGIVNKLRYKQKALVYSLYVPDGVLTDASLFQPLKEKVVQFAIHNCVNVTTTSKVRESSLTELVDFGLFRCSDQEIKKADFELNTKLKRLVFHATTISSIERNAFDALAALQMLQLEEWWKPNEIKPSERAKFEFHLQKSHCSCEYKWLRDWLSRNPNLFQERSLSEFYTTSRDTVKVGEMYIAVNCRSVTHSVSSWKSAITTRFANKRLGPLGSTVLEPFSKNEPPC